LRYNFDFTRISSVSQPNRHALLERVRRSFLRGRALGLESSFGKPARLFAEQFKKELSSNMSAEEVSVIDAFSSIIEKALSAAKANDLQRSSTLFHAVRSSLRTARLSERGVLTIQIILDPAEAYCHYKKGHFDLARELLLSSASVNHRLSREFGARFMGAQRMQLCQNILRIAFREREHGHAVRLVGAYLDYLERGPIPLPEEIDWARFERDVPTEIVELYFNRICGEAALTIADSSDPDLFAPIRNHAHPRICSGRFASQAHLWILTTAHKFDGKFDEYLNSVCSLLELGRNSAASLWYGSAADVAATCRLLGDSDTLKLARFIDKEISEMKIESLKRH
jgi:hypothetical protein